MTSQPLKECPFCGRTPNEDDHYTNQGTKWGGIQCCIEGPEVHTEYKKWPHWKEDAIEAWNTRTPSKDRELLIELSMPEFSTKELSDFIKGRYVINELAGMETEVLIALKIRKHLEANP
jgi:hypothetical protein